MIISLQWKYFLAYIFGFLCLEKNIVTLDFLTTKEYQNMDYRARCGLTKGPQLITTVLPGSKLNISWTLEDESHLHMELFDAHDKLVKCFPDKKLFLHEFVASREICFNCSLQLIHRAIKSLNSMSCKDINIVIPQKDVCLKNDECYLKTKCYKTETEFDFYKQCHCHVRKIGKRCQKESHIFDNSAKNYNHRYVTNKFRLFWKYLTSFDDIEVILQFNFESPGLGRNSKGLKKFCYNFFNYDRTAIVNNSGSSPVSIQNHNRLKRDINNNYEDYEEITTSTPSRTSERRGLKTRPTTKQNTIASTTNIPEAFKTMNLITTTEKSIGIETTKPRLEYDLSLNSDHIGTTLEETDYLDSIPNITSTKHSLVTVNNSDLQTSINTPTSLTNVQTIVTSKIKPVTITTTQASPLNVTLAESEDILKDLNEQNVESDFNDTYLYNDDRNNSDLETTTQVIISTNVKTVATTKAKPITITISQAPMLNVTLTNNEGILKDLDEQSEESEFNDTYSHNEVRNNTNLKQDDTDDLSSSDMNMTALSDPDYYEEISDSKLPQLSEYHLSDNENRNFLLHNITLKENSTMVSINASIHELDSEDISNATNNTNDTIFNNESLVNKSVAVEDLTNENNKNNSNKALLNNNEYSENINISNHINDIFDNKNISNTTTSKDNKFQESIHILEENNPNVTRNNSKEETRKNASDFFSPDLYAINTTPTSKISSVITISSTASTISLLKVNTPSNINVNNLTKSLNTTINFENNIGKNNSVHLLNQFKSGTTTNSYPQHGYTSNINQSLDQTITSEPNNYDFRASRKNESPNTEQVVIISEIPNAPSDNSTLGFINVSIHLQNANTSEDLKQWIINATYNLLKNIPEVKEVKMNKFEYGIVEMKVMLNAFDHVTVRNVTNTLKEAMASGHLGNITLNKNYLVVEYLASSSVTDYIGNGISSWQMHVYGIVGCICALALITVILGGCKLYRERQQRKIKQKHQRVLMSLWKGYPLSGNSNPVFEDFDEKLYYERKPAYSDGGMTLTRNENRSAVPAPKLTNGEMKFTPDNIQQTDCNSFARPQNHWAHPPAYNEYDTVPLSADDDNQENPPTYSNHNQNNYINYLSGKKSIAEHSDTSDSYFMPKSNKPHVYSGEVVTVYVDYQKNDYQNI